MTHTEHIAAARRTIKRARQADSSVLYAAKLLACECKKCKCNFCGNHPHKPGGHERGSGLIYGQTNTEAGNNLHRNI